MSARDHGFNENHRRALSVALAGLDEVLCEIAAWADGREARGVLYVEKNDIPPPRRAVLRRRVEETRRLLVEARDHLGLTATQVRASRSVWSRCCGIRDTLNELDARHMKGYGQLSPEPARFLNDLSARLVSAVDRLAEESKASA